MPHAVGTTTVPAPHVGREQLRAGRAPARRLAAFGAVMVLLYAAMPILYEITGVTLYQRIALLAGAACMGACLMQRDRLLVWTVAFVFGASVFGLLSYLVYSYIDFLFLRLPLAVFAGLAIYRYCDGVRYFRALPILVAAFFVSQWWAEGNLFFVLYDNSYNHVSVIMLSATMVCYLTSYRSEIVSGTAPLWPAITALVVCALAIGRGGILSGTILLAFTLASRVQGTRALLLTLFGLPLASLALYEYVMEGLLPLLFDTVLVKFVQGGVGSSVRFQLWAQYLSDQDAVSAIVGYPLERVDEVLGMTLHNAYLQWHQRLGMFAFVQLGVVLVAVVRLRRYLMPLGIVVTILARGVTDTVVGSSGFLLDPILAASVFLAWHLKYVGRAR